MEKPFGTELQSAVALNRSQHGKRFAPRSRQSISTLLKDWAAPIWRGKCHINFIKRL
jgi:hypothetical protein